MRKVLFAVAAVGILSVALMGSASASETQWGYLFKAGNGGTFTSPTGSLGTTIAYSSTITTVVDDPAIRDPKDGGSLPPPSVAAVTAWYRPTWTGGNSSYPWAFSNDYRTPLEVITPGGGGTPHIEVKSWDGLVVWATSGYTAPTIHLFAGAVAGTSLVPATIGGLPFTPRLVMTFAPAGYNGAGNGASGGTGTAQDPYYWNLPQAAAGQLIDIALPSAGADGTNPFNGDVQTTGYMFSFVTPEPGSILVLASGLTGLVGLVTRRRRA